MGARVHGPPGEDALEDLAVQGGVEPGDDGLAAAPRLLAVARPARPVRRRRPRRRVDVVDEVLGRHPAQGRAGLRRLAEPRGLGLRRPPRDLRVDVRAHRGHGRPGALGPAAQRVQDGVGVAPEVRQLAAHAGHAQDEAVRAAAVVREQVAAPLRVGREDGRVGGDLAEGRVGRGHVRREFARDVLDDVAVVADLVGPVLAVAARRVLVVRQVLVHPPLRVVGARVALGLRLVAVVDVVEFAVVDHGFGCVYALRITKAASKVDVGDVLLPKSPRGFCDALATDIGLPRRAETCRSRTSRRSRARP